MILSIKVRLQNRKGPVCFPQQEQVLGWTRIEDAPPCCLGERLVYFRPLLSPMPGGEVDPVNEVPVVVLGHRASPIPASAHLLEHLLPLSSSLFYLLHQLPRLVLHVPVSVPGHENRRRGRYMTLSKGYPLTNSHWCLFCH